MYRLRRGLLEQQEQQEKRRGIDSELREGLAQYVRGVEAISKREDIVARYKGIK